MQIIFQFIKSVIEKLIYLINKCMKEMSNTIISTIINYRC